MKMKKEKIKIIETNIDNLNPEIYPHVIDKLLENGALDAYMANIVMKKGRLGIKLSVLCYGKSIERLSKVIFEETSTLGIRILDSERVILERETKIIRTKYGQVRVKISKQGSKVKNITPEYDDCVKIARSKKIPLKLIYEEVYRLRPEFKK